MSSYATPADLAIHGIAAGAVGDLDMSGIQAVLDAASDLADSYLRNHYRLPLAAPYPFALVEAVCKVAAFNVLSVRGYNPEGDAGMLESRYKSAMKWLEDVGAGKASPLVQDAAGPASAAGGPFVVQPRYDSSAQASVVGAPSLRGW